MKICAKCKFPKDEWEFNKKKGTKDNRQHICKLCDNERAKLLYANNKEHYKKQIAERKKRYKQELNSFLALYLKEHPCVDCGEEDIRCLDFDHVRDFKFKNISKMKQDTNSLDVIKNEISKCEVRCANCHRKKTCTDQNWYKIPYCSSVV